MIKNAIIKGGPVFWLPKLVISILASSIFVLIAKTLIAWECPITVGPDHLKKDLALSGIVVEGSPLDETIQYIMAMNTIQAESSEIVDYARVELWAPIITLKPGFHAKPDLGDGYFRTGIPTFKVNCVNMVDPSSDPKIALDSPSLDNFFNYDSTATNDRNPADHDTFRAFCENEIDILNHHFVNEEALPLPADDAPYREQLIRFRLNQVWEWVLPEDLDLEFYNSLTTSFTTNIDSKDETFNASSFSTDGAITIVYYRHPDGDRTSYWQNNVDGLAPWVLINYRRSDTNLDASDIGDRNGKGAGNRILDDDDDRTAAHEHEIGHLFQVHHIYDERVESSAVDPILNNNSNIMNTGGTSVRSGDDAYDAASQLCSTGLNGDPIGKYGNRALGFWYEPYNGETSDVCQYWNKTCLEYYDNNGAISSLLADRALWSQVEIILYSAKHYKETWAD